MHRPLGRVERQQALGLAALGIGVGLAAAALGNTVVGWIVGPLGVAAVGAAVVWREADESQRRRWTAGARATGGRTGVVRVLAGALFVTAGIAVFLLGNIQLGQVQFALLAVLATLVGVAVITVPWWVRLMRELGEERRERIVESERADDRRAPARLGAADPRAHPAPVRPAAARCCGWPAARSASCARWLYGPAGYGRTGPASGEPALDAGLAAAIATAAARGRRHLRRRRPPRRGRRPPARRRPARPRARRPRGDGQRGQARRGDRDQRLRRGGARRRCTCSCATAASGSTRTAVPDDRHGLADSVRGRMTRHGGDVRLRSAPGDGTEVHLSMPVNGAREPAQARAPGGSDDMTEPAGEDADPRLPRRRPRAVPLGRARRARPGRPRRHRRRGGRLGRRGRGGRPPPASRRGAAGRAHARRRRGGGAASAAAGATRRRVPGPQRVRRRRGRDRGHPGGRPRLRHQDDLRPGAGRRRAPGAVRGRGVLARGWPGSCSTCSPTGPVRPRPATPSSTCSPVGSATCCACWRAATPTRRSPGELFISVKTVETHVSSVLRKTQLSNRYELSRWASDRRLV